MTQGFEANHAGSRFEAICETEFRARNIPVFDYSQKGDADDFITPRFLLRRVPYQNLYGKRAWSEYVYRDGLMLRDIRIECRWQQVSGSCDEKFPFLLRNAVEFMPEPEVWLVLGGDGAHPKAVHWLRSESAKINSKKIRPLSLSEFYREVRQLVNVP